MSNEEDSVKVATGRSSYTKPTLPRQLSIGGQLPVRASRSFCTAPCLLTAFLLIGVILRFSFLTHQSLWFDEIASIRMAQRSDLFQSDFHPPLYFSLLNNWILLFGPSEFSVRLLSALLGIASLFAIGVSAKRLLSTKAAGLAVLLTSCSFSHLWYSQEVRAYILLFLESAILLETYRRWILHPQSGRLTAVLIGINTTLLYTHYGAALLLSAQGCHIVYLALVQRLKINARESYISKYTLVVLGTTILSLPLLPLMLVQSHHVANGKLWLPSPAFLDIYLLFPRLLFYSPGFLGRTAILMVNVFIGIALLYPVLMRRGLNHLHFSIVIPPILALLLSFFGIQMFAPKVLITILPALIIASTHVLCRLPIVTTSLICFTFLTAQGLLIYRYYTTPQKEGWRTVASFLSAHAEADDTFYFTAPGTRLALEYYYRIADHQIQSSLDTPPQNKGKVWIIYALTPESWKRTLDRASSGRYAVITQKRAAGVRVAECQYQGAMSP